MSAEQKTQLYVTTSEGVRVPAFIEPYSTAQKLKTAKRENAEEMFKLLHAWRRGFGTTAELNKMTDRLLEKIRNCAGVLALIFLLSGCGVYAGDIRAVEVFGPTGVRCFAIVEDGKAIGGNCL